MKKINLKYKIPMQGQYHKGVNFCPHCNYYQNIFENCIGFCTTDLGTFQVIECEKCFEKYRFHSGDYLYECFLDVVEVGDNKHFKE